MANLPPSNPKAPSAKGLVDLVETTAKDAFDSLERGMVKGYTEANAALATPEGADLSPLLGATDLPELPNEGPLGSLGVRLDREADLLRNVALRELSRVSWMERVSMIMIILSLFGEALIAASATFSAVMGTIEGRAGMFTLAAFILAGATAGATYAITRSKREHRNLAADAMTRSRKLEEKLFRLALVMEWRASGPELYQDALARLERSIDAPAGAAPPPDAH